MDELAYWVALNRVPGLGPLRFKLLLAYFHDNLEAAWEADAQTLAQAGLDQKTSAALLALRAAGSPERELERLERRRLRVLTLKDGDYPPLLREIHGAPPVLYVAGSLSYEQDRCALGVVGTRKVSSYGRQVSAQFARDLARGGVVVVSGLARGVDTIAHTATLDAGGRTLAVLANGLDSIYPPENLGLARRIVESGQGALLTELPLGVRPAARNFPARNRIIAGLAMGVLITEAPERSGSLITANFALEQGREVFAVPNGIYAAGSAGSNKLLQDGAHLVTRVEDIVAALNLFMLPGQPGAPPPPPENDDERALLALLGPEPSHIDEITRRAGLPTTAVSAALLTMELKGMVRHVGGMRYTLSR